MFHGENATLKSSRSVRRLNEDRQIECTKEIGGDFKSKEQGDAILKQLGLNSEAEKIGDFGEISHSGFSQASDTCTADNE